MSDAVLARTVAAVLILTGAIHLAPVTGLFGADRLKGLYGVDVSGAAELELLLRHRAVLFGLLGACLVASAFRPELHGPALIVALVSVGSFLWLAAPVDALAPALRRVQLIDYGVLLALLVAGAMHAWRLWLH